MEIVQVGALGIAGVLLAVYLKQDRAEMAIFLCIGVSILIFMGLLGQLNSLISIVQEISSYVQIEHSYIATLMKMLGITYLAEFSSGICKDAGYQTIASQIEIFGKIAVLVLSMPILLALLKTIQEFWT